MNRRRFVLLASGAAASQALRPITFAHAPALVPSDRLRPQMPSGVQVGDVTAERAIIWSRTDRPARMIVEFAANEQLRSATTVEAPAALENSDFTARLDLGSLTPGEMVFYRVRFESLAHPGASSDPVARCGTVPPPARSTRLDGRGSRTARDRTPSRRA